MLILIIIMMMMMMTMTMLLLLWLSQNGGHLYIDHIPCLWYRLPDYLKQWFTMYPWNGLQVKHFPNRLNFKIGYFNKWTNLHKCFLLVTAMKTHLKILFNKLKTSSKVALGLAIIICSVLCSFKRIRCPALWINSNN